MCWFEVFGMIRIRCEVSMFRLGPVSFLPPLCPGPMFQLSLTLLLSL